MAVAQIEARQGTGLATNPGYVLRKDAANAWDRAVGDFGKQVLITGAWRSYETQERIFLERYRQGNRAGQRGYTTDVRYWPARGSYWTRLQGTAAAAVPGTSNHGGGVAVDVKTAREAGDPGYDVAVIFGSWNDSDRLAFLRAAKDHGWDDDEGRSVNELWHLTYYPERDKHKGEKPKPLVKEIEFMAALDESAQKALAERVAKTETNVEQIEVVVRRHERVDKERRVADLEHARESARRQRETDNKVEALAAKVDALIKALEASK